MYPVNSYKANYRYCTVQIQVINYSKVFNDDDDNNNNNNNNNNNK
jgi:hypothetical protein